MNASSFRMSWPRAAAGLAITLLVLGGLAGRAASQAAYSVTALGPAPYGSDYTVAAAGLNNAGVVVGTAMKASGILPVDWRAFAWKNGVWTDLNAQTGYVASDAYGINDAGEIVGDAQDSNNFLSYHSYAMLWANGSAKNLGTLGQSQSRAYGINAAHQIVGTSPLSNGTYEAFRWQSGLMTDLGDIAGNGSKAVAIHAYGYAAGSATTPFGYEHAAYWDTTGLHDMGTLGGGNSRVLGLMPGGTVFSAVGSAETGAKDPNGGRIYHAFVAGLGSLSDLGTLGGYYSEAAGVNDYSQVVGWSTLPGSGWVQHAFIYSAFGVPMYDLNNLIPSGSGIILTGAVGISDAGQIVANGQDAGGNARAFLLTPLFHIGTLAISPTQVPGSENAMGTITLDHPVPFDCLVLLSSNNAKVALPVYCVVPAYTTSQSFLINTTAVTSAQQVQITATLYNSSASAPLTVRPIGVKSLVLAPKMIQGGNRTTATVTLEAPAAPQPITVTFSSSNTAIVPTPAPFLVPQGTQIVNIIVATNHVAINTTVTLKATANGITKSAKLTVTP